ncbi:MAG: ribosomal L7Ae/L30e/S12e/Gadd45 family protein [Oscillospiraceae bacterium]|nr:ribosomal L7Ae/L30e/S12e/Gadd45 family protein [Oscillospiraceae bacterium]
MNSHQKTINLLSICRKAGRLIIGFDAVKDAVIKGDVSCVLVTENISPKTLKEIKFFCGNLNTDIVNIGTDSDEMFNLFGKKVVVAAVTDLGFGKKFRELSRIIQENPKITAEKDNSKP